MTKCPETLDGVHLWEEYERPAMTRLGDIETVTVPAMTVCVCWACGEDHVKG